MSAKFIKLTDAELNCDILLNIENVVAIMEPPPEGEQRFPMGAVIGIIGSDAPMIVKETLEEVRNKL